MILMNIECFRFQVSFHFVKSGRAHAVMKMFDFGNERGCDESSGKEKGILKKFVSLCGTELIQR